MTYLSIFERLNILFNELLNFKVVLIFSIIILLVSIIYVLKFIDKNKYVLSLVGSFASIFAISIISNYKVLSNTFDNFATIFFGNIYFPSIYVYIVSIVIVFISFILSIFNSKLNKVYKKINISMFILNNIIFAIIINIIAKNKIDIFSINSLYTSKELVAILEVSMGLFILWLLSLIIAYTTNVICEKLTSKKEVSNEVVEGISNSILEEELVSEEDNTTLNDLVYETIDNNELVYSIENNEEENTISEIEEIAEENTISEIEEIEKENVISEIEEVEEVEEEEEENSVTFDDILNGRIPLVYYDKEENNSNNYEIINPQEIYEERYNNNCFQDFVYEIEEVNNIIKEENTIKDNVIEIANVEDDNIVLEEITEDNKNSLVEERLINNTISLNDLVDDNDIKEEAIYEVNSEEDSYTIEDYKKMIQMLKSLKNHSNGSNISIDKAITYSLIDDKYSIDDCVKLKDILESNLN